MSILQQTREALRLRHYAYTTEPTDLDWIEQFIHFHKGPGGWRHPRDSSRHRAPPGDGAARLRLDPPVGAGEQASGAAGAIEAEPRRSVPRFRLGTRDLGQRCWDGEVGKPPAFAAGRRTPGREYGAQVHGAQLLE
jgi:hypothetical protein